MMKMKKLLLAVSGMTMVMTGVAFARPKHPRSISGR